MEKSKEIKMKIEDYNNVVKLLDSLQLREGINNATKLAQIGQLLNNIEIIQEKEIKAIKK